MKVPAAKVDVSGTFAAAHASLAAYNNKLRCYLDRQEPVSEILARLEQAGWMDLSVDGDGVWRCQAATTATAPTIALTDADYQSFRVIQDPAHAYAKVRVRYGYNPTAGTWASYDAATDPGVPVRHGSDRVLEVQSYLDDDGGAITIAAKAYAERLSRLSAGLPRVVEFSVHGRLTDSLPGQQVSLTRTRALDSTGALSAVTFRLANVKVDHLTGLCTCVAVEVLSFL